MASKELPKLKEKNEIEQKEQQMCIPLGIRG